MVLKWFKDLYPSYLHNDLYLAGESYAGIYIPRLLEKIHMHNNSEAPDIKLNLKGMLIINGVTNYDFDNYEAELQTACDHFLVD